jgi:hypothetical protein
VREGGREKKGRGRVRGREDGEDGHREGLQGTKCSRAWQYYGVIVQHD